MKVRLTIDEAFRVYIVDETNPYSFGFDVEVPEALISKFTAADKAFRAVDDELYEFYKVAHAQTYKETRGTNASHDL